jgi:hypothetical protein
MSPLNNVFSEIDIHLLKLVCKSSLGGTGVHYIGPGVL